MQLHLSRALLTAATCLLMALIFGFSSQTGPESGSVSGVFTRPVTDFLLSFMADYTQEQADALYYQVDGVIRKTAHFVEYTLLGLLLCLTLQCFGVRAWWLPVAIGVVYAAMDEWHQAFTPQRTSSVKDVLLDSLGVLCGVAFATLIQTIWRKKHVHHP